MSNESPNGVRVSNAPNQQQIDWQQEFDGVPLYQITCKIYSEEGAWKRVIYRLKSDYGVRTYPENARSAVMRWLCPPDVMFDRKRPNSVEILVWFADFLDMNDMSIREWLDFCAERAEIFK